MENNELPKIEKVSKYIWKIEKSGEMLIPIFIYASEKLIEKMKEDRTLIQARNMASLPGVLNQIIVLSDAHEGYGACIGGVAAYDSEKGVISPGEIGYDIGCSVRLLKTNLIKKDVENKKKEILDQIYRDVPSGVGRGGPFNISRKKFSEILKGGAQWMVENGYGEKEDYLYSEEEGKMKDANPEKVTDRAISRGIGQLGTIGAGNHFLEIQYVDEIFDEKVAKVLNLEKNQVCIMIHCGSRGLGHQIASDYIKLME